MPEIPAPKPRPHPWSKKQAFELDPSTRRRSGAASPAAYAELHTTTNFTFLTGASHPEEFVEQAAALGHRAIAITDRNSLAGIVRAHVATKEIGIPLVVGCRLELPGLSLLVYPTNRASYARLCRLLTIGKRRAEKGSCHLTLHDVLEHADDLLAIVVPPAVVDQAYLETLAGLASVFTGHRLSLAASRRHDGDDVERLHRLVDLARHTGIPLVATNDVHYHVPERRALHDVLACIRHGCTIQGAGYRLAPHAERCLKPPEQLADFFAQHPRALSRSVEIAERGSAFSLDELRYEYPEEVCPPGRSPMQHLRDLTARGARERYPRGIPGAVRDRIAHELALIDELRYPSYFLTVHDIVRFARSRDILCQGRGAAANSAVCYCLGVTAVDPDRIDLLFERFISKERDEPPDIDIDFEHERREEVIQYIYGKYGRDRAALTAEVISYRGRSAVREVGKALGLSLDCVDRLARNIDWWHDGVGRPEQLRDIGIDPDDPSIRRLRVLSQEILGFPRHLSQHVGGFVITQRPLCELVPIENAAMPDRTVIEWDKDDIDAVGMMKVDVLGLGMLTCIRKAFEFLNSERPASEAPIALHTVPPRDPLVYDMICAAETVGVFQIESRAQMSMLPRLRPRTFYDLVIEVAIVRPGPIQGDMVHPYLRRRNGEEPVTYPDERVKKVLGKTLGVPLFQEQAMSLAIVAAGFTAGEADQLRRAMAAWKRRGNRFEQFRHRFLNGMIDNGYDPDFADRCFRQLKGFSEYGFPESHAASFALLVYVSSWLKRHHPAAFAAALINSQPMGFYAPAQIVRDARDHGVEVRPVDVNHSGWDCTLENGAMRLGMRLVKGLKQDDGEAIRDAVLLAGPFDSITALRRASGARVTALRRLANADAFGSLGLDRQHALWTLRAMRDVELPMFEEVAPPPDAPAETADADRPRLPEIPASRQVVQDYAAMHLSLKAHPFSFLRPELDALDVTPARELADERRWANGRAIIVAGLVLVRQRPSTANGIVFMTLEDETGISNLIVRPTFYRRFRKVARHGVAILARGKVERQGEVVHVMVRSLDTLDQRMERLASRSRDFH